MKQSSSYSLEDLGDYDKVNENLFVICMTSPQLKEGIETIIIDTGVKISLVKENVLAIRYVKEMSLCHIVNVDIYYDFLY